MPLDPALGYSERRSSLAEAQQPGKSQGDGKRLGPQVILTGRHVRCQVDAIVVQAEKALSSARGSGRWPALMAFSFR
jgi:hypothetical protein